MSLDNLEKYDLTSVALLNRPDVQVLSAEEERASSGGAGSVQAALAQARTRGRRVDGRQSTRA